MTAIITDLTRKYRPGYFSEVIGQGYVVDVLEGMFKEDKIPASTLFHGPYGTGKTTLARIMAYYMSCTSERNGIEPCGECVSCQSMLRVIEGSGVHPDLEEIDAASDRGVGMVRTLRQKAKFMPRYGMRTFIIDEAHMLTKEAFNAFLKTIEEPPRRTKFIFCTTAPEALPSTVRSRMQSFQLHIVPKDDMMRLLLAVCKAEKVKVPKKLRNEIADASQGHVRDALKILEQVISYWTAQGGKVKPEEFSAIVEKTAESYAPWFVVHKYLEGLMGGKYGQCMYAIQQINNHEYAIKRILDTLQQILLICISPSGDLLDDEKKILLKGLRVPDVGNDKKRQAKIIKKDMQVVMEAYMLAISRIKEYLMDPAVVMQVATLATIDIVSSWTR